MVERLHAEHVARCDQLLRACIPRSEREIPEQLRDATLADCIDGREHELEVAPLMRVDACDRCDLGAVVEPDITASDESAAACYAYALLLWRRQCDRCERSIHDAVQRIVTASLEPCDVAEHIRARQMLAARAQGTDVHCQAPSRGKVAIFRGRSAGSL